MPDPEEPAGESRTHEHDYLDSGGNRAERTGRESQITQITEPPADGQKPSAGGFFVVPPKVEPEAPASVQEAPNAAPVLDEEEISDLIDAVLFADDLTPDTRE